jgi:hypothetical protein
VRRILSVPVATGLAVLAALVLGEYEFTGWIPFVAGPLFGLVVGEVVVSTSGRRGMPEVAVAVAAAAAGLAWGAWRSSSEGLEQWPVLAWPAIALGAAAAGLRGAPRRADVTRAAS